MLLTVIYWLLSVLSIITTAILNVGMASFNESSLRRVPRIDFSSLNFASL